MKNILRKTVGVMLILLILFSSFTACVNDNTDTNQPSGDAGENKPSEDNGEGKDNMPEEAPDANQPSEGEDNTQVEAGVELGKNDSELIDILIKCLKSKFTHGDKAENSLAIQINRIKRGEAQPLLIKIDPDSYYFVCCYSDTDRVDEMLHFYQNSSEYTWVKYEEANDIRDSYNGKKLIEPFQINIADFARDIITDDEGIRFEHIELYSAEFVNGSNVNPAKMVDKAFIYLNEPGSNTVYYSERLSDYNTIDCVKIENRYYFELFLYEINPDGEKHDFLLEWELGEYYDEIMSLITGEYSIYTGDDDLGIEGCTQYYGLVEVDKFSETVLK